MRTYIDRFENHPVHEEIEKLLSFLQALEPIEERDTEQNTEISSTLNRIRESTLFVQRCLKNALPHLSSMAALEDLNGRFVKINSNLNAFISEQNIANLHKADTVIDSCLSPARSFFPLSESQDLDISSLVSGLNEEVARTINEVKSQRESLVEEIRGAKEQVSKVTNEVEGLKEDLKKQQGHISNLSVEHQKQFSEAQEARRTESAEQIEKLREEINQFSKNLTEKLNLKSGEIDKELEEQSRTIDERLGDALGLLSQKDEQASKLLEAVGIKTHTSGYAETATVERKSATFLRYGAIALMILGVAFLIGPDFLNLLSASDDFAWQKVLYRIPSSLLVFTPAVYLASESAKHRKTHVENKRMELEMAALMPYLESLGEEEKKQIKEKLVDNYFVGHKKEESDKANDKLFELMGGFVDTAIDKVISRFPNLGGGK